MTPPIDAAAVLWSAGTADRAGRPLLILLHGFGSHEGDLFTLAPYLPLRPVIASLRAPLMAGPGHAWYPLQFSGEDMSAEAGDVAAATVALLDWIDALDPSPSSVGLLGFSQGGSMAIELMRARPDAFDFAVVLAGFVADGDRAGDPGLAAAAPPVFWGRGTEDAVIPTERVDRAQEWLPSHSTLTERIYEGVGHSVSDQELRDVVSFLAERYR